MALKSLRVTKKELQTYYTPKVSDYEMMVNSINSNMGYGQIIQAYTSTETGVEVTNTYYHVYDNSISEVVVMDKTSGLKSSVYEAGPNFWGISSEQSYAFLYNNLRVDGLRKLKYCDGCSDGNGLDKPVVDNFSKRFRKVEELVLGNNLLEGFLFYDLELPKYSNVFPAIKKDDGVNITYQFKNVNTGADLTPEDVAAITDKQVYQIEESVDTAPVIKPQEGANTVITSCCDESISYVIQGQYTVGNILYTENGLQIQSYCWFVESLTKETPTLGQEFIFSLGGRSCEACVKLHPCPTADLNTILVGCCDGLEYVVEGTLPYPDGSVVYTKDLDPATCFTIYGKTKSKADYTFQVSPWKSDCKGCADLYPGGCK
jgi:hypothetical protein